MKALVNHRPLRLAVAASFAALLTAACDPAARITSAPRFSHSGNGASSAWSSGFAILSAAPHHGGAVTCTDATVNGDVGSSGAQASVVQTNCTITGAIIAPVSDQVVAEFNAAYDALAAAECDQVLTGTLAGVTLEPGVYCFEAAAALTGTLTLDGPAGGTWLFKIGTNEPGALTGTNFTVVMTGGGEPCDVTWWVDAAATLTDSDFVGTIYAGAAITTTRGTFEGNAYAKAAVTLTGTTLTACEPGIAGSGHGRCNQGVGNGPENCDPGNSNQGDEARSNDERGGTPGNPGRKGGNGK